MNKRIGIELAIFSLVLVCIGYTAHHFEPTLAKSSLFAGLIGGVLCFIWGLRTIGGSRNKALPILTLIPVAFVLLSQVVAGWLGGELVPGRRGAAAVLTVGLVLSVAMLMRVAYAGVVFESVPANPTKKSAPERLEPRARR